MKTLKEITEILEDETESKLLEYWNDYCQENNNFDAQVFEFDDEFFETYFSSPAEAARATYFGDIENWACKYVTFNGYGNLEAKSYLTDMISISDLSQFLFDNQQNYNL